MKNHEHNGSTESTGALHSLLHGELISWAKGNDKKKSAAEARIQEAVVEELLRRTTETYSAVVLCVDYELKDAGLNQSALGELLWKGIAHQLLVRLKRDALQSSG